MHRGVYYARAGGLGIVGGSYSPQSYFEGIGCAWTGRRPVFAHFRGDIYCVGYYSRPVVEHNRSGVWVEAGIRPPTQQLMVAHGTGVGGSNGLALCYITGLHKIGELILAESNPSNVVDLGELGGLGRVWSNVQTNGWDERVTHVRGYVSVDGAAYRQAWERGRGVPGLEENIPTARLSNVGPGWTHGIPPSTLYARPWVGRMWYANSRSHPYRLWHSEPGYPQYVAPASFLDTPDREEITAIWNGRAELLVFARRGCYMVREAAEGTFVIERLDTTIGCINFFGIRELNNVVWFPAEDTFYWYNGQFIDAMPDLRQLWGQDYRANPDAFRKGWAVADLKRRAYIFVTNRAGTQEWENTDLRPKTVAYVGCWGNRDNPEQAVATPDWMIDLRARADTAGTFAPDGMLLIGSEDGVIRVEDPLDPDDDGDSLVKPFIAEHGHRLLSPGGDNSSGAELQQFWAHVESETNPWRLEIVGGDEWACLQMRPDNQVIFWKCDVPSSLAGGFQGSEAYLFAPDTSHFFVPQRVSGKGFTARIYAAGALGMRYRGYGCTWSPGQAPRGPVSALDEKVAGTLTVTIEYWDVGTGAWVEAAGAPFIAVVGPLQLRATAAGASGVLTLPAVAVWTWSELLSEGEWTGGESQLADVGGPLPFAPITVTPFERGRLDVNLEVRDSIANYSSASASFWIGMHPPI